MQLWQHHRIQNGVYDMFKPSTVLGEFTNLRPRGDADESYAMEMRYASGHDRKGCMSA